ncbi:hypothetical protein BDN72DRAFT_894272 [Pluteus cervinus]|uniref:Uncharacterized protein n=1 Tax=Pluteus cervinus TaxID=181527 RepID=A0ACD3B4I6_9AGAR|nr:hypothetical protein BDN72DRAFT_894272 [Pluteus cervinus]
MDLDMKREVILVDNTMGAAFIGVIFAGILYGVSCVQTWYYFNRYPTDAWYIKSLVGAVWAFDTVHQALISHTGVHRTTCTRILDIESMAINYILTILIIALVLSGFACSTAFTIESMQLETWAELAELKGLSMTVNVLAVVTDVIIAAALFFYLHRSRTGFKRSDTMISKLIMFTVSTGLLTSICAVASLLTIVIWGETLIYVAFYFSLGRLYSNSILATLNARKSIRGLGDDHEDLSFSLQSLSKIGPRNLTASPNISTGISIKIDTTQEYAQECAWVKTSP